MRPFTQPVAGDKGMDKKIESAAVRGQLSRPIEGVLLKTASYCNMACTYCYWFRDAEVYKLPPKLRPDVADAFIDRLDEHLAAYDLDAFVITFHGGEPLVLGKNRFIQLLLKIKAVEKKHKTRIRLSVQTNGLLLDQEWVEILLYFQIQIGISIDGDRETHDKNRPDLRGRPTYELIRQKTKLITNLGGEYTIISVCSPQSDPTALIEAIKKNFDAKYLDVLIPDMNHTNLNEIESVADYYIRLFDIWLDQYQSHKLLITIINSFVLSILGVIKGSGHMGLAPQDSVIINTDGNIGPHDALAIAGRDKIKTDTNVFTHALQDIYQDEGWLAIYEQSKTLPDACKACEYQKICGGGFIGHRWSPKNGYNNPSVYCEDYKKIINHISARLAGLVSVSGKSLTEYTAAQRLARAFG